MARRVFLIGTDTDCGKTTVACALLRAAGHQGVRALPFKPAASGPTDATGDPERLVAAAGLAGLSVGEICPLRYAEPVAPGLAEAGGLERFLRGGASDMFWRTDSAPVGAPVVGARRDGALDMSSGTGEPGLPGPLPRVCAALAELELRHGPELTVIEGAGGLWVPMPGGTWLPAWIEALAAELVVVGRLGLGTINHCLLTFAGLAQLGLRPRGFILAQTRAGAEPAHAHNEQVIAAASGLPCLGVLGFQADPNAHGWLRGGVRALVG